MKQSSPRHGATDPRRRATPRSRTVRRASRGRVRVAVVGLLAVAAFVGGGVWLWANRTVSVRVNGELTQVRADATLEEIAASEEVKTTPGDLVSVGGNVLTEGAGAPFSATVGGSELDAEQIEAFRAKGNEEIVFGDGADVTEASHEEERETAPKMEPYERIGAITYVAQWGRAGKAVYTVGGPQGGDRAGPERRDRERQPHARRRLQGHRAHL